MRMAIDAAELLGRLAMPAVIQHGRRPWPDANRPAYEIMREQARQGSTGRDGRRRSSC